MKKIILFIMLVIMTLCTSCNSETPIKTIKYNDIYDYANINIKSIDVKFDNEYIGEFEITDNQLIENIYNLILDSNYNYKDPIPPTGNIKLTIKYNNGDNVLISSGHIVYNDNPYFCTNKLEIDALLINYALENKLVTVR